MSLSLSCAITKPYLKFHSSLKYQLGRTNTAVALVRCESNNDSPEKNDELPAKRSKLEKGSPIIITEAPKMIKTAASVPCLRVNSGLVKPGDVGRKWQWANYHFLQNCFKKAQRCVGSAPQHWNLSY